MFPRIYLMYWFYLIYSYLLYTIDKKREDTADETAFSAILDKIMKELGVHGVTIKNRIVNVTRKKFGKLDAKIKKTRRKSGGTGVKRLTDKWHDQTYNAKIFYHEIDNFLIEQENQDLLGEKRTLEESLK